MAGLPGTANSIQWIYSGGTVTLNTDYRTSTYTPSVDLYDDTAGGDTSKSYIVGLKDGQYAYGGIYQNAGTAIVLALAEGTSGTLVLGREGTAAGKPKETFPAIAQGAVLNVQYNNLIEISCNFQQNGARVDGAF